MHNNTNKVIISIRSGKHYTVDSGHSPSSVVNEWIKQAFLTPFLILATCVHENYPIFNLSPKFHMLSFPDFLNKQWSSAMEVFCQSLVIISSKLQKS